MDQRYYDPQYSQTNRDRSHSPKRVQGWCDGCDTQFVAGGKKCPQCGHKQNGKRRMKK